MPRVKCYSAPWLSKDAPGYQLFEPLADTLRSRALLPAKRKTPPGPRRTIARRGTEVFVAVGREIRWGDLLYIKDDWLERQAQKTLSPSLRGKREDSAERESEVTSGMRVIKTPVAEDIRQLIVSPNSSFLAVLTTHTVHICVLPDSSHLTSEDRTPLKPKMFTLGPTTHVTSRSPIASALWHPLGVNGSCLVTVTADAIVRLWELSTQDRWSFDSPTSSIDLKKLADGTALEQDFSASTAATNKTFSPDEFEMEVAAAAFGNRGSGGWNPMTLWVAMREGDVYALCPLLPQRWAPPPTLIPSLSVSIVTAVASTEDDASVDEREKLLTQQQLQWMGEIDSQEPQILEPAVPGDPPVEVYTRPSRPGTTPRLQGPFDLQSDPETGDDLDTLITDILVIGKKTETDELMLGEDDDDDDLEELENGDGDGLSLAIVCLLSTSGQVRVYLDTEGVQAQWLPPKSKAKPGRAAWAETLAPRLLAFQALDTMTAVEVSEDSWPVFSADPLSRYSFFVTHHAAITFVSLLPWVLRLEGELSGDYEAGADFRLNLLVGSPSTRERIYGQPVGDATVALSASVALRDPDLGYFLLSSTSYEPIALSFEDVVDDDDSSNRVPPARHESPMMVREREASIMAVQPGPGFLHEPRPVYQAAHVFSETSVLPELLDRLRTSRHKTVVGAEVKLSPLTLQIFTDAHKVLSDETHRLGVAAAEVFRRCEMLQMELLQQVRTANEVRAKIDAINGTQARDRAGYDDNEADNAMYDGRIRAARERQERLVGRLDELRRLAGRAATRDLSHKERAFAEEVKAMEANVLGPGEGEGGGVVSRSPARQGWKRLEEVKRLQAELVAEAEAVKRSAGSSTGSATPEMRIPQEVRRGKLQQVQGLLSREMALVDAVTSRLERLQASL